MKFCHRCGGRKMGGGGGKFIINEYAILIFFYDKYRGLPANDAGNIII
jgi:hypothetical protein